ncbi:GNAT family N-acetyltransferase [Bacteroides fragilis]|uniref:GNAT family N-acetyltransferase n=1 Tax=Bacteroides fragilis str. 2-F-2 \|nr:hypothetical protein [Bacteroides fragilis]EXY16581.1 hypothetical protein M077_4005 [Bacteroides fragilis str. 2-F-2 \
MTNEYIQSTFQIRKQESDERIESFDCGDADLNDFILNESLFYREALLAVSYVFEDKATGEVAAYFSLANDRVSLSDFADKTEFNRFRRKRFPNEKRMKSYPAGKLCRFVTVDAYRSAMPFYEKNGFLPLLEEDDGEMTRLLYFDLADYKNSMQD